MKKHKKIIIAFSIILCACLAFCISLVTSSYYRFCKPLIDSVDENILHFDSYSKDPTYGNYRCNFSVVSDNAEGVGDEMVLIYEEANRLLKSEENNIAVEICITVPHYDHDCDSIVAQFGNYDNVQADRATVYDHIYYVCGLGISRDAKMYDDEYDYEINHKEYWDVFSDADELSLPRSW